MDSCSSNLCCSGGQLYCEKACAYTVPAPRPNPLQHLGSAHAETPLQVFPECFRNPGTCSPQRYMSALGAISVREPEVVLCCWRCQASFSDSYNLAKHQGMLRPPSSDSTVSAFTKLCTGVLVTHTDAHVQLSGLNYQMKIITPHTGRSTSKDPSWTSL